MTEKKQQVIRGTVVKISSANTIRVSTKVTKVHPLYRKRYTQQRFFMVHDPLETAKVGELITIASCRPISKNKHWVVAAS